jgi:hypothetical protein
VISAPPVSPDGRSATVKTPDHDHLTSGGGGDCEATGVDHTVTLRLVAGRWLVAGDVY